ncbi:MAG TPA: HEPN domain-containing protein, partial [Kofleriaceae bacterium]|nr:HEPN domain-containing protein [Kofleriaceae bacterium]
MTAFLDDVDLDLEAARRLVVEPANRLAAFHLQQAAEKLIKAVRLSHGLRVTADHNLELLIDELPRDEAWRDKLTVLEPLAAYATSYRYPS